MTVFSETRGAASARVPATQRPVLAGWGMPPRHDAAATALVVTIPTYDKVCAPKVAIWAEWSQSLCGIGVTMHLLLDGDAFSDHDERRIKAELLVAVQQRSTTTTLCAHHNVHVMRAANESGVRERFNGSTWLGGNAVRPTDGSAGSSGPTAGLAWRNHGPFVIDWYAQPRARLRPPSPRRSSSAPISSHLPHAPQVRAHA